MRLNWIHREIERHQRWRDGDPEAKPASFIGHDFGRICLRGEKLQGAKVYDSNFSESDLRGVDLRDSNASKSCFDEACLRGARMDNANCEGSTFVGADLRGASFRGANLRGCDFFEAIISGVDFEGADLTNAAMVGAIGDDRMEQSLREQNNVLLDFLMRLLFSEPRYWSWEELCEFASEFEIVKRVESHSDGLANIDVWEPSTYIFPR